MFGKLFNVAMDVVTLPVAATVDLVNAATLGMVDEDRDELYTETGLKNLGRSTEELLDTDE